eukprot:1156753-Pelagomonas_calceolata.AAC.7
MTDDCASNPKQAVVMQNFADPTIPFQPSKQVVDKAKLLRHQEAGHRRLAQHAQQYSWKNRKNITHGQGCLLCKAAWVSGFCAAF